MTDACPAERRVPSGLAVRPLDADARLPAQVALRLATESDADDELIHMRPWCRGEQLLEHLRLVGTFHSCGTSQSSRPGTHMTCRCVIRPGHVELAVHAMERDGYAGSRRNASLTCEK